MSDGYARRADPTARRTGRHGPVPGWGWRDARRILQLGKKEGVSAVVLQRNGDVRFNLLSVYKPPLETSDAKVQAQQAKCQQRVAASATPVREPAVLNSAQRRSARRLQEYQQQRRAHTQGAVHSTGSPSDVAGEPAQVEPDVRNAEAAHCEAEATSRGQERAADESSAYEHQPSPHREQLPHTGASRPTHTQAPTVVDLATINKRQAERGGPRGSITCRFCGGRHQSSHRMPLCRCEQPGWYEHMRPWSPPKRWPRGSQPQSITSPKRALENDAQEGERPTTMVRRRGAV
jgi:negative regulator of sigma E activity